MPNTVRWTHGPITHSQTNNEKERSLCERTHTVTNSWEPHRDVLLAKANHLGNPPSPVSKFDYDIPLPNGTPSGLGANVIGQRTTVKTTGTAFPVLPRWTWGYDSMGQLTSAAHSATSAHSRYYGYDTIGNRRESRKGTATPSGGTLTSYYATADGSNVPGANSRNQYAAINSVKPIHDADGNMTSGPVPTATTSLRTLVWDAENRLTEVKNGSTTLVRYHYDAAGRRIAAIASGVTTLHLYDGWNPIAEYAGQTLSRTYLWGMDLSGSIQGAGGVGGLLAVRVHGTGAATYYPTFDGNGNVSEYLNASSVIKAHYEYDPFGNTLSVANLATEDTALKNALAHRFSTKPRDAVTGLYYYGYRWYDPVTGRWPSRDPIGERGGVNLYTFVWNNGISWLDYRGLWGDGNHGNPNAPEATRGHSDFPKVGTLVPGMDFDYTVEDHDKLTSPVNVITGTSRHFRPLDASEADLATACKRCRQSAFERAAHQMQDFFSHYGQGYRYFGVNKCGDEIWGHLADSINYWTKRPGQQLNYPEPDNATHYKDAFEAAKARTGLWVERWKKCCRLQIDGQGRWFWEPTPGRDEKLCSGPPPPNPWGEKAPAPNFPN